MRSRRIVAVAHFPPPVHGMAAVVDRLIDRLEEVAAVRRVTIAAPGLDRSPTYHLVRIARVLRALAVLAGERRRCSDAFFSCDAGGGMLYTLVLTAWARLLGYRMSLQHHSYAYLDRRSAVLSALVRFTAGSCVHLVSCARMRADLLAAYPGVATRVVGIATGIEPGDAAPPRATSGLVLGLLGNVSVDKGLDLALATVRTARTSGVPVTLRVAGPVVDAEADRLLSAAEAEHAGTLVTRVGPVYGTDRDAFLDDLDVFLFPSRYAHESFGLVAWEAMARGVPLLAHRSGCLTSETVGDGGLVVERDQDFVAAAVPVLERWWHDPRSRATSGEAARARAGSAAAASERDTARFCRDLAGVAHPVPAAHATRGRC